MSYLFIFVVFVLILAFVFSAPPPVKENFQQSQFVLPEHNDTLSSYYTPDIDWTTFEAKMKSQMKSKVKKTGDSKSDLSQDVREAESGAKSVIDQIDSDVSSLFDTSSSSTSDQRYILQKQKSAPRFIPKFPKQSFLVYKPKDPPLRYATRPGPNSFDDVLSEAAHIETPKEMRQQSEAQKSAQERHEDLLRRTNWIFQSANRLNHDSILKQPKMIPGPANENKYRRRYSHYGIA